MELTKRTAVTVELGVQTIHQKTADKIGRAYPFDTFIDTFHKLKKTGVRVCVHLINGLPGESDEDMVKSAEVIGSLYPDGVKVHMLHVMEGTPLAPLYRDGGNSLFYQGSGTWTSLRASWRCCRLVP